MAWTYMLYCADGTTYVGSTRDLERRLQEHACGRGSEYTSTRLPVSLAWAQEFERVVDAYAMEKRVQNWSRAKRDALVAGDFDEIRRLARKPR